VTGETAADRRLHPATLFIRFVKQAPEFLLGLPAVIGFASNSGMGRILLIALVGAIISFGFSLLNWLRFRYGVGERDIVIEKGVFQRQRRVIPFDRVQDIDIEQPFLSRLFGTAKVRIETGGGGKNEGDLDAVSLAEAHRLRDVIRSTAPASKDSLEAAEAPTEEPLLFGMDLRRLLLAGLFNFSLFYLAVIGGALQYFDEFIERNLPDPKTWVASFGAPTAALGLYVSLLLIALLLLLGVITGLLRTISRDYRFRLWRTPAGFRRRRGLFTLSEVVIPLRRVQLAIIGSGWLRRRLGWFSLQFQTLSADSVQSGHQAAAPFARMGEIERILREAGLPVPPPAEDFIRVSRLSILRRYVGTILPLAAVAAVSSFVYLPSLLAFVPLVLVGAGAALQWRRHRYILTERALFVSEGVLAQRLWFLPYEKVQTISVSRSPLQRRFGLASVAVDTAGASVFRSPSIRDVEGEIADALAQRLLHEYRAARARVRQGMFG
jgi:putative membrane protein